MYNLYIKYFLKNYGIYQFFNMEIDHGCWKFIKKEPKIIEVSIILKKI